MLKRKYSIGTVKEHYLLSKERSARPAYHISIKCSMNYQPGDAVGILPNNRDENIKLVSEMLINSNIEELKHLDLDRISRKLTLFLIKNRLPIKGNLVQALGSFKEGVEFEVIKPLLEPIRPRLYSIASSPNESPNVIDLTVGVKEDGLCSHFLKNLKLGDQIPIYLQESRGFRLPNSSKDIIMIGPGTGVAPFRSFIKERLFQKATGKNWLLFGSRNREWDFYYEEELLSLEKNGDIKLDLAFSRDQDYKHYVQDIVWSKQLEIIEWLERGSYIYICGEKSMGTDVERTLERVLNSHSSISLEMLKKGRRYIKDTY